MAKPPRFGASEPLQVFQDDYFYHPENMTSHAPMPAPMKQDRKPLQASNGNIILNPPRGSSVKPSPFKSNSRAAGGPLTPLKPSHGNKLNMVHVMPPTSQPRSTDSLEKKQPPMSRFKTVAQKPAVEVGLVPKKDKVHQTIYPAPPAFNIALETYCPKPQGKRVLLDAAPIKELRPVKKPRSDDSPLPPHDSFPPIVDDGSKPGHSYAQLIGMAILRSPQRRLTLAQIYKWISDSFSFYSAQDAGWQNSIRHNLSLNKHFIKQERPKDDPGKGNYWAIEPGMEHLFMKEKPSRKPATTAENLPVMSTRLEPSQPPLPVIQEPMQAPQYPICQNSLPPLPPPSSQEAPAALAPDVSSDATIAVSDAADPDDVAEKSVEHDAMHDSGLYSPLPVAMHSSPPIPRHLDVHSSGTPPPMQRPLGSSPSKSRSHKRKFASMDDSGYISSLESSAMRPQHQERLTSEADRPRIKRGRAEEEIARLRASSYDSPTKGRSWNGYAPPSSSPLRQLSSNDCGQMLPPLTPAMKLKAPQKPPPSVSPSTNLRLHRESVQSMIDSPYRRVASILPRGETMLQLTPGFNVDEVFYGIERKPEDHNPDFDIFQDGPFAPMFALSPVATNGSPTKRSAKRQRLDRSHSTSALNENSSTSYNSLGASSFLKVPGYGSALGADTPSKIFDGLPSSPSKLFSMQSPSKMPAMTFADTENIAPWISMDDLCSPEFLEDNDFSGIDMLAGFEKIGSNNPQPARQSRQSQKPGLGRSYTTTF